MRDVKIIPINEILAFVAHRRTLEPPVFWLLAHPRDDGFRLEEAGPARRRADSNTLELVFPVRTQFAPEPDQIRLIEELQGVVRRYAAAEDERDLRAAEGRLPSGVSFELQSRIPATERAGGPMLEVVGPGGRATAFAGVRGMTGADVTIRHRSKALNGRWRRVPEILRPLELTLGEMEERLTVRATFGYFELSKYEAQSLMRPVFLFAIEQEQDPEGRWPAYQRIVVSSATTAVELDASEGLGMWSESMRCLG